MGFTEDLDAFYVSGDPGIVTATVGATAVIGEFQDDYAEDFGIEGEAPRFSAPTARLPASHGYGTTVVIGAATYRVVGVQPDGTGVTVLILEYVSG